MALQLVASPLLCTPKNQQIIPSMPRLKRVVYAKSQANDDQVVIRRSANFHPNVWDHDSLMSLKSNFREDIYKKNVVYLLENVRKLLVDSLQCLDLVDAIQRLGLSYHYKEEIKKILDDLYANGDRCLDDDDDLYTASLRFRLFRQHGYTVPQDSFRRFLGENGKLKMEHTEDAKGMLSLYEASYFGLEGEDFMDEVKAFTTQNLKEMSQKGITNPVLAKKVAHSLEIPLHWRATRLETRWYIDVYGSEDNMVATLLHLAKLDFNVVQAIYQSEVRNLTSWWVDLGLHKLEFSRDRILEHYFWAMEMVPEQQYGRFRDGLTQQATLITLIDDVYDVYGTLEELELFTDAVERWEVSAMEQLPQYMKICYLALLNTNNQMAYEILQEQGFDATSNLKQMWVDLCKTYLVEAKWYYGGHTPTFSEYLNNAMTSIGAPLMLTTCYLLTTEKITKEGLDCVESMPSLISSSGVLLRLADDLATATEEMARGDVPKSIQCYMREANVSEEIAREYVKHFMDGTWKKMNKALLAQYPFSEPFITSAPNLGRQAQSMYQYGDGQGIPGNETKVRLNSLLIEPIMLNHI